MHRRPRLDRRDRLSGRFRRRDRRNAVADCVYHAAKLLHHKCSGNFDLRLSVANESRHLRGLELMVDYLQRISKTPTGVQVVRQRPLDRIEIASKLLARGLARGGRSFGCDPLLAVGDLRLHLPERIEVTVARHGASSDRRLQFRANLVIGIEIGFEMMALELRFRFQKRRVRCCMAAAQVLGATAERRQFGVKVFHEGFSSEECCHAEKPRDAGLICEGSTCGVRQRTSDCCGAHQKWRRGALPPVP
ncbi:hypothetical protein [Bradyrhizobium australiense]|uniref:Uncharacterized protein n=1 Tax=Bradyrhizobium australiense TaxID=2721161 RepID=A0A7Y4LW41_9BRAD|nr:hypothetical protein [Bradyrhizobium australiense]NOJ40320.1 hypothetical protein [Bradyrhizobium australiense]